MNVEDLARYETVDRRRRLNPGTSRDWRARVGERLEAWGRRLRAGAAPVRGARTTLTLAVR